MFFFFFTDVKVRECEKNDIWHTFFHSCERAKLRLCVYSSVRPVSHRLYVPWGLPVELPAVKIFMRSQSDLSVLALYNGVSGSFCVLERSPPSCSITNAKRSGFVIIGYFGGRVFTYEIWMMYTETWQTRLRKKSNSLRCLNVWFTNQHIFVYSLSCTFQLRSVRFQGVYFHYNERQQWHLNDSPHWDKTKNFRCNYKIKQFLDVGLTSLHHDDKGAVIV